jgi:hypothetical protein
MLTYHTVRSGPERRIRRWEQEAIIDAMQERLSKAPEQIGLRRQTVEQPFGTLKAWMGATHFLTKTLDRVSTEMSLHVLAYNIKRLLRIMRTELMMNWPGPEGLLRQRAASISTKPHAGYDGALTPVHLPLFLLFLHNLGRLRSKAVWSASGLLPTANG